VLAHFIANEKLAATIAAQESVSLNTDNLNLLEYQFARTVGQGSAFSVIQLRYEARTKEMHRPRTIQEGIDWEVLDDQVAAYNAVLAESPLTAQIFPGDRGKRHATLNAIFFEVATVGGPRWETQSKPPDDVTETAALAFAYAITGNEKARELISRLQIDCPTDAVILTAVLAYHQEQYSEAAKLAIKAIEKLRSDATVIPRFVEAVLRLPVQIVEKEPQHAVNLLEALDQPLAVYMLEERRLLVRIALAQRLTPALTAGAVEAMEPHVPWDSSILEMRATAYEAVGNPLAGRARRELTVFRRNVAEDQVLPQ
jgi:hypothetical protein